MLFFENQLGVVRACMDLADLWGLPHSRESPPPPTPGCVSTPISDPSVTVTPESSPSVFPLYRAETCMEFLLITTSCKSIDAEFVCYRLQNTIGRRLNDTNNNFSKHAWSKNKNWNNQKLCFIKMLSQFLWIICIDFVKKIKCFSCLK